MVAPHSDGLDAIVGAPSGSVAAWVRLLRPHQWAKNIFVLAPLLFSGHVTDPTDLAAAGFAFVVFCVLASGVYALNDARDCREDRVHPVKRLRPVAAGVIGVAQAYVAGTVLMAVGFAGAVVLDRAFAGITAAYVVLNLLYTFKLKHVVILDVFCVAAFFLLRLLGGSVVIGVVPSVWLLTCGGLLALYLGFTKRRHELVLLDAASSGHRAVLSDYDAAFLDQVSSVLLSVTVVAYLMYTLTSETAATVGSDALSYSTVFVLYGVFRYSYLVHRREAGNPTETLLTDWVILANSALWLLYVGWVIYRPTT